MQLYAYDKTYQLVSARKAHRQQDYICLECSQPVRRRAGLNRQPHFYHFSPSQTCRQSGKSIEHLQTQLLLQRMLPPQESALEHRFPEIHRVADLVWFPQKIVFEVQCSSITAEEVSRRNQDYQGIGYQVVWILHDQQYSQERIHPIEYLLYTQPHYFTNTDSAGRGEIYDQWDLWRRGRRRKMGEAGPVDIGVLKRDPVALFPQHRSLPEVLKSRLAHWPLHFSGDLIDKARSDPEFYAVWGDLSARKQRLPRRNLLYTLLVRPYALLFQYLLEKCCR